MSIEANEMELRAAEALLQLRYAPRHSDIKLEIEGAATLFMSCMPTRDTPSKNASSSAMNTEPVFQCSVSSQDENLDTNSQSSFDSPVAFRGHNQNYGPIHLGQKKTSEQGTQTDDDEFYTKMNLPGIEKMDKIISELNAKIRSLQNYLKESHRRSQSPLVGDVLLIQQDSQQNNINKKRKSVKRGSSSRNTINTLDSDAYDDRWDPKDYKPCNRSKQIVHEMLKPKGSNIVPIGEGYASVPARLLKQIDWTSYTGATRKLLTAVFSRRVLATHSLTGKPSPAFPGKPAKKRLQPELVNDIVQIVVERCGVPENVVRTSITTKCADESKMYRSRQQNKKKQQSHAMNQENVPPSSYNESSDDMY